MRRPKRPPWVGLAQTLTWAEMARVAEIVGYSPHEGQLEIHQNRSRHRVAACGRRFGKSVAGAFECVCVAAMGGYATAGGPTADHAAVVWGEAERMILESRLRPLICRHRSASGRQLITLATGGMIDARASAADGAFLGRGRDLLVFDEAAREPNPEVYYQDARPSLSDTYGSDLFLSTPRGDDWFHELFERGQNGLAGYASWQMPTTRNATMPHIEREVAEAKRELPLAIFQQEYLAQFLATAGAVFGGYREVATAEWQDAPIPGHVYVMGVDIAQYEDFTVCVIYDLTAGAVAHIMRINQVDYPTQEEMIAELARKWSTPVLVDATNNQSVTQHLKAALWWTTVEGFVFTNMSKKKVVNQLKLAIEQAEIRLPARQQSDDAAERLCRIALAEIGQFRYDKTAAGTLRMSAPEGRHDDCVIAVCLAYEMALRNTGHAPTIFPGGTSAPPTVSGSYGRVATSSAPASRRRRW